MILTDELRLLDIAATSTLNDERTRWIYESIDFALQKRNALIKNKFGLWNKIEIMSEQEIDILLWGYSNFSFEMSLDEKKALCKKIILSRATRGTIGTLQDVCKVLYDGFEVKEWFQYGGNPGTFKISTHKKITDSNEYSKLINVVCENKNERSHLEYLELHQENTSNYYVKGFKTINIVETKDRRKKDFILASNLRFKAYKQMIGGITK